MPNTDKILWVVNYDSLDDFVQKAIEIGASGVAIRTDNDCISAIDAFHKKAIKVYAWRWPSAKHNSAIAQANNVASLLKNGLDGFYVDPEGDPGKPWDWNQGGLDGLADEFCNIIKQAGPNKPFGVTSHYLGKPIYPKLPWTTFFKYATVFLPQAYWRSTEGVIGHGLPADNYDRSITFWSQMGADASKTVPMAGELASVTGQEIAVYAGEAQRKAVNELHFYAYDPAVSQKVWDAIAAA